MYLLMESYPNGTFLGVNRERLIEIVKMGYDHGKMPATTGNVLRVLVPHCKTIEELMGVAYMIGRTDEQLGRSAFE